MLLTLTNTQTPATDLGYLLHKHPDKVQSFALAFGQAHVFYPTANETQCTAALLLDVDPVGLVRRDPRGGFALAQYVNDRPYAASSFLSVAIGQVYRTALTGRCEARPELVAMPLPLTATVTALPCRGGERLLRRLFEPLGYAVQCEAHPLDPLFPSWGDSSYFTVTLSATVRLQTLLAHLYVLIPVLDDQKHYYVGREEVEKLLRHAESWLPTHPEQALITRRYLRHDRKLMDEALARLVALETPVPEATSGEVSGETPEARGETRSNLHQQRLNTVLATLRQSGAHRVVDLGCGEGQLLALLLRDSQFSEIVGMDVDHRALEIAAQRLKLDQLPTTQRARIRLLHSSLIYRDARLAGYDAAAVVEVVEHLDPPRLAAFARVLFEYARPGTVVLTTPNREYNIMWEGLPPGQLRHPDHRFEWTRAEFAAWTAQIAARFGYTVTLASIGDLLPDVGAPTQMAHFTRHDLHAPRGDR